MCKACKAKEGISSACVAGVLNCFSRIVWYSWILAGIVYFFERGLSMDTLLLVAFGLVAFGAVLRLVFFTSPKDKPHSL
jgi:hypothetical protein